MQHVTVVVAMAETMVETNFVYYTEQPLTQLRTKLLNFVMTTHINIWVVHTVVQLTKDHKALAHVVKVVMVVSAAAIQAVVDKHVIIHHTNPAVAE